MNKSILKKSPFPANTVAKISVTKQIKIDINRFIQVKSPFSADIAPKNSITV